MRNKQFYLIDLPPIDRIKLSHMVHFLKLLLHFQWRRKKSAFENLPPQCIAYLVYLEICHWCQQVFFCSFKKNRPWLKISRRISIRVTKYKFWDQLQTDVNRIRFVYTSNVWYDNVWSNDIREISILLKFTVVDR